MAKIDSKGSETTKKIGDQLVALRKALGFTQAQITATSGLTPTRVVDLEQGRTNYTIESLATYLNAIGKDLKDLTLKENEKK
jgi:transcriptional regulator with XRE-family HTH domain